MTRVFADSVVGYAQAGWSCVIPVPAVNKHPPPTGFTGADGRDTDPLQLVRWSSTHAGHSVALRMPDGVVGLDVDHYDKGTVAKRGADTLAELEQVWGVLPTTWCSTARGNDAGPGPSRILFFRVPVQRYATKLGPDIEIIQRHHRYAVVAPSVHEVGGVYRWYAPDGAPSASVPKPDEFPELPAAWVAGLLEGATSAGPVASDAESGQVLLDQLLVDGRVECVEITGARQLALSELAKADEGGRHDTMTGRIHHLVQLAALGHTGVGTAITDLHARWGELTAGEDRRGEFERMLLTSARKAVTAVGASQVAHDPCLLTRGFEVAAPGPTDDRPDADDPAPIEPARWWSVREVIGAHAFDPQGALDQTLGQAVLERTWPVLRYAHDSGGWLLRRAQVWETTGELARWSVTEVASLMPLGDPKADKDSDDFRRAQRRGRFHTQAGANAIAGKMHALVSAGTHPCALRLADLDAEPDVLWAGGQPWDLRASHDGPIVAQIDPNTPHLHAAAVEPHLRPTPLWDAFVAAVWPDQAIRAWALRVLSVALTGHPDRALPILLGETGRGKTQAINLLMSLLGTYAHAADPRLLGGADNSHASIVYALKGRRLSFIDEGPREGRWAQERLKQLTGGAELTGNRMRENPVTFFPTHTLVLTANDEPTLTDPAIRARVRLIPCDGDPDQVSAARAAIGNTNGHAWRAEAPGVLAAMMREAAGWLADRATASTSAAPESVRFRAEELAADQDPVRTWLEETEPHEPGTPARQLYQAFWASCRQSGIRADLVPSETKWGRALTRLGYPSKHTEAGKIRQLRIRPAGLYVPFPVSNTGPADGLGPNPDGLLTGSDPNPSVTNPQVSPQIPASADGLTGWVPIYAHTQAHTQAHPPARSGKPTKPVNPSAEEAKTGSDLRKHPDPNPSATAKTRQRPAEEAKPNPVDEAKKATKAAERAEARRLAVEAVAGPSLQLPVLVPRGDRLASISVASACRIVGAIPGPITIDVETTGYPVGHNDYAMRTVQLGTAEYAVVFDATDAAQREAVRQLLDKPKWKLHAHSATADLVPLAHAGLVDLDNAWERMHDTVIMAKLADPASTGSDPGLKQLATAVLGDQATSPTADEARAGLFKAGRWLTDTKVTTPLARSGWAQVDSACETMVRYAASDVLDDAALARQLPQPEPAVLERERTAQRMTARVAYHGLRIDGEHVAALLATHTAARTEHGDRVRAFGIDNPGSNQQVAAALEQLGAQLPRTKTGRASVAEGVLDPMRHAEGPVGQLVTEVLQYRHHDTAIGTFLEPYQQLVRHGDGRARPTVYTLAADTGRMSCVRPNLQQVPREGGFRACITADPGQLLVSADFSGVELRVAAALSQDANLARMISNGVDLHWEIARQVFGPDATKADRYKVKRGVFGRVYGGGVPTLAKQVGVSEQVAGAMVDTLDHLTPGLSEWSRQIRESVKAGRTQFRTYAGRVAHLPPDYPHKAPNYCIQGTARELLVDALLRWKDTPWGGGVLLPVHDEILAVVPEAEAAAATDALVAVMSNELYGLPIIAEASAPSYAWADAA